MKVNLSLEVTESQRNVLARLLTGKDIKRLATRDEVREFVAGCIESLTEREGAVLPADAAIALPQPRVSVGDLLTIDPEDEEILRGKAPGYIVGWNRVKRKRA